MCRTQDKHRNAVLPQYTRRLSATFDAAFKQSKWWNRSFVSITFLTFSILLFFMLFAFVLPNTTWGSSLGALYLRNYLISPVKVSIVIPYTAMNRSSVLGLVSRWTKLGSPCMNPQLGLWRNPHSQAELLFYINTEISQDDREMAETAINLMDKSASCFSQVGLISAGLKGIDDIYPAGPSNMFLKIFHDESIVKRIETSTHMFWMEPDVNPIRSGWVDALLVEASRGDFWVSGSPYQGEGLDDAASVSQNWDWIGHINGNALYNLKDEAFREFLRVVAQYEPANHFWKPFDVSMWRVLHAFPYTWPLYRRYRSKFVHSEFINHWAFHILPEDARFSHTQSHVYFIHGNQNSAGNVLVRPKTASPDVVWDDRVQPASKVSIFISNFLLPHAFCYAATMSALKYVSGAQEVVLVVADHQVQTYRDYFANVSAASNLKIYGQVETMDATNMQKWVNLHADKYCTGDIIVQLSSEGVINRQLQLRDILWAGKPILQYRKHEKENSFPDSNAATSFALGVSVNLNFAETNLHVHPAGVYRLARAHLDSLHGVDISKFLTSALWTNQMESGVVNSWFDEFDFLGAFCWKHRRADFALVPQEREERRKLLLPPPVLKPFYCKSMANARATQSEMEDVLGILNGIWMNGLQCHVLGNAAADSS